MLIIILVSVLIVGAIAGNYYTIRQDRKSTKDPLVVNTPSIAEILKDVPKGLVEEKPVIKLAKKPVSKNTAKQESLAKMEAKPKKKVIKK
jgi:uncharacterized protein YneF (UPF0154 family)